MQYPTKKLKRKKNSQHIPSIIPSNALLSHVNQASQPQPTAPLPRPPPNCPQPQLQTSLLRPPPNLPKPQSQTSQPPPNRQKPQPQTTKPAPPPNQPQTHPQTTKPQPRPPPETRSQRQKTQLPPRPQPQPPPRPQPQPPPRPQPQPQTTRTQPKPHPTPPQPPPPFQSPPQATQSHPIHAQVLQWQEYPMVNEAAPSSSHVGGENDWIKIPILPEGDGFDQHLLVVKRIASIIRSTLEEAELSWKKVSKLHRDTLFDLFKSKFTWPPQYNDAVRRNFEKRASAKMVQLMQEARKDLNQKPEWMGDGMWDQLKPQWESLKFRRRSAINKRNRNK